MKKYLNIKNIVILLVVLAVIHFGVGLVVSPMLSDFIISKINKYSGSKIYIEKVRIWPLTLSLSLKNLKVFDPDNEKTRIAEIKDASVYISPLGLLSRRLVSSINVNGAEIDLRGEPDGTFNIQKLTRPKKSAQNKEPGQPIEVFAQNKDLFGTAYDLLKKKFSEDSLKMQKASRAQAKKVTKVVTNLPRGRRVHFRTADSYIFKIKKMAINNARLNLKSKDNRSVQLDNARIELRNVYFDPELGSKLGRFLLAGQIKNSGVSSGNIGFIYNSSFNQDVRKAQFDFKLKDVNLDALRFIYEDSLPVQIVKGTLNLESKTSITDNNIDSHNNLSLSNHELRPKGLNELSGGLMPVSAICDFLNNISPASLDFTISGTVENPQFSGFTKSLMGLIKPNLKNIQLTIKNEGIKAIGGLLEGNSSKEAGRSQDISGAINSIQSVFGNKKKEQKD